MKSFKLTILFALTSLFSTVCFALPIDGNIFADGTNTIRVAWNAEPGKVYLLQTSTNVFGAWANVFPVPGTITATSNQIYQPLSATDSVRFYRVTRLDTDGPEITQVTPLDGSFAVSPKAMVKASLVDETGINTNTISFQLGTNAPVTLSDSRLGYADGVLTYTPGTNEVLGLLGSNVTARISAADTLGYLTTNSVWTFQIALPTVPSTNILFIPGSSGFVLASTNGDNFTYTYTSTFPGLTNGQHLVNTNVSSGYTRTVVAFTNYPASNTVVVLTRQTKLAELLQRGSISGANFTEVGVPASPAAPSFGLSGARRLPPAPARDFGLTHTVNLQRTLYQDANLLIELLPGSTLTFTADIDFAMNFDWFKLRQFAATFSGSADYRLDAHIQANGSLARSGSIPIITPPIRQFYFTLVPAPGWVEVVFELNAGYELNLEAHADYTTGIRGNKKFLTGRRYDENEGWTKVSENPPAGFAWLGPTWQLETTGNLRVYLQPKLTLYAYSAVGISADLQPYLNLEGHAQLNPHQWDLSLYGGLDSTFEVDLRLWDESWGELPDVSFDLISPTLLWEISSSSSAPEITNQPHDQWVSVEGTATFTVQGSGPTPLSYRWQKNGLWLSDDSRITGTRTSTLKISNAQTSDAGNYRVVVSNPNGTIVSEDALLTIYPPYIKSGMVLVPAGSFTMGDVLDGGAGPIHTAYVSGFYMDEYEVTKALWDNIYTWATNHGYTFDYNDSGQGKANDHPAHSMSWYDAVKWCNARSEKEGRTPAYYTSASQTSVYRVGQVNIENDWVNWISGYRLPTEAEWEKAARGGIGGRRFPWSDTDTISWERANYFAQPFSAGGHAFDVNSTSGYHPTFNDGLTPYTSPVGYFAPNGYGIYDMAGNVWEWCWDWYGVYSNDTQTDPRGPTSGLARVDRGGDWYDSGFYCRTALRASYAPANRINLIGFRSVLPSVP